ncbi:MAG: protein-glutamate O-methyltransferase CheR [Pirellulales bacterium]|nr:protein-glutamate O-methyltransferase CheR [Pirellulales bacterium]
MSAPIAIPPLPGSSSLKQVSDDELGNFAELIYRRTGIHVSPQKKMLLSNRLRRRLRETGIEDFSAYYQHLKRLKDTDPEWDAFLQEITTHETYLFRDESQWNWFRTEYLAGRAAESASSEGKRTLRIWSAACSTGDEPYTAACCIAAALQNSAQWNIRILGTDIGVGALAQAEAGIFGERAMRLVPEEYRRRFFVKAQNAQLWQARPMLTAMLRFRQHNLMSPLREKPFDIVFLKNVLIYFDGASKRTVVNNVRAMIRPGGLLVAGAAEGITEMVKDMKRLQPWLYRK